MSEPTKAVFLSYAREDADAARRIAEALRAFGIEVWFDQNELRGGDAWDASIRKQIRECALFVPVVSATTQARTEGYFRREWRLAVERMQDMASGVPFIVPVVIDETPEKQALVPDEFMRVHWTRMVKGIPSPQFVDQVKKLLADRSWKAVSPGAAAPAAADSAGKKSSGVPIWVPAGLAVVFLGVLAAVWVLRAPPAPVVSPPAAPQTVASQPAAPAAVAPAAAPAVVEKSIAVLPFANMSPDKENDFIADGIHEDVLTSLAKIRDLKVISRTSVLAYRDTASRNLKKIAADLGVAVVLEGSVRRMGTKLRVTAQLIDARTDEHLWAENYDGDTSDVFALQAKLAQQIAAALKATLTPGERSLIERRPTQDAQAYEFYQRAKLLKQGFHAQSTREEYDAALALYEQALARDPGLALAHADLVFVHGAMYWFGGIDPTPARRAKATAALVAVQRLAPDAPETRMAQGLYAYLCENDWNKALVELHAAAEGLPNDDQVQYLLALSYRRLGRWKDALDGFERAVALNPHDRRAATSYIETLYSFRRFESLPALAPRFLALFPTDASFAGWFADAQFEIDGDKAAWLRRRAAVPPTPGDVHGLGRAYSDALQAGDLAAADRALGDPRQEWFAGTGGVANQPATLLRAELAALRGDPASAKKQAEAALATLGNVKWAPRQEAMVRVFQARARLCAGVAGAEKELWQEVEAVVRQDKFLTVIWLEAVRTYAATGHREEGLAALRRLLAGPATVLPGVLRVSPYLTPLKSDPRFEEILRSAKPL
jgi:TolB-like protein